MNYDAQSIETLSFSCYDVTGLKIIEKIINPVTYS